MGFDLTTALNHIDIPADWIGLRYVREVDTTRYLRDRLPQSHSRSETHGVMVEVLAEGQFGYASTNLLTHEALRAAAAQAYQQSKSAAPWGVYPFTVTHRPPATGRYRSPRLRNPDHLSSQDLNELLQEICTALRAGDRIVTTTAYAVTTECETHFVSSNGSDIAQEFLMVVTDYAAIAQEGNRTQRRGDNGMVARCSQAGMELFDREAVLARARTIGQQALELLDAIECPTTTTHLVLAPDQMLLQIHESIGHPLELDRILGDERNYAGSSFVRLEDFGHLAYGSPHMNVTFDPTVPGEYASYAFDDIGIPAQKEYLIQEGILLRGLGSIESQARSGVPGVANARATSWNRPAIDRMANINLEPGCHSVADIISGIEFGVYMESNRSWSIDDYRQKFQFGCEYGRLIEGGQLTRTVRNPNYRGITTPFWHSLAQVGNGETMEMYGSPFCGKGEPNQVIRVGHASPVCLFENVEVFGGG
ncbi:MAG: TldD/PmbA family protein [Oscillatoriales cyanobacterium SM2_2_1]|nr:TldD/PmbA family protein [Oscillatoriales cyanobacterium SM2_2_1]